MKTIPKMDISQKNTPKNIDGAGYTDFGMGAPKGGGDKGPLGGAWFTTKLEGQKKLV